MASDWSFNVWQYGLVGLRFYTPVTKAARKLDGFPPGLIVTNGLNGTGQYCIVAPPGTVFPDVFLYLFFTRAAPHFPFGDNVEPDLHT